MKSKLVVKYTVTISGARALALSFRGSPVQDSPYQVYVKNAPIAPLVSVASGAGMSGSQVGVKTLVTITARDVFGNQMTDASRLFTVQLAGAQANIRGTFEAETAAGGIFQYAFTSLIPGAFT